MQISASSTHPPASVTHHQHPGFSTQVLPPLLLSPGWGPRCPHMLVPLVTHCQRGVTHEMAPGTRDTVPPAALPYLAWHQVADGDEGGVSELQNAEHLAGHDVQGQARHSGQAPRAALRPALGHWGTGRALWGRVPWGRQRG